MAFNIICILINIYLYMYNIYTTQFICKEAAHIVMLNYCKQREAISISWEIT